MEILNGYWMNIIKMWFAYSIEIINVIIDINIDININMNENKQINK